LVITAVGNPSYVPIPFHQLPSQLKVCLDEWADGVGNNIDFSMGIYQKVYNTALKFLEKASQDLKYKEYMQSLCEKWFKHGR
jgi:hypothetical protein